jgi:hypothetical protein
MVPVESSATVPVGFTHGAAQVNVMLAAPVSGDTGWLNVALTLVLSGTAVAFATGISAVTVGGSAVVVNCQLKGLTMASPFVWLTAAVTVAV